MARVFYSYGQAEGTNFNTNNKIVYKITAAWFLFVFVCLSFFRNNYYVSDTKANRSERQRKFIEKRSEFAFINDTNRSRSEELLQNQYNLSFTTENAPKLRVVDAIVFIGNAQIA